MTQDFINFISQNIPNKEDKKLLYSYLLFFCENDVKDFVDYFPEASASVWSPKEPKDIVQPIIFFTEKNISLYTILSSTLWVEFFDTLLSSEDVGIFRGLGSFRNKRNELLLLRAGYRYGHPFVDDDTYNIILDWYTYSFKELSFLREQTYDDDVYDDILLSVLKTTGILCNTSKKTIIDEEIKNSLDQEKSTSILPVEDYNTVFDFLQKDGFESILFSLKIDGVNTKKGYSNGKFVAGLSRGRSSEGLDYTDSLSRVVPLTLNTKSKFVSITSEAFVDEDYLSILRKKYPDKQYKTPKSSAISMLRNSSNYNSEDFKHLHIMSFDSDGLGKDKLEVYKSLQEQGFKVPPHIIIYKKDIPKSLDDFIVWLDDNILEPLHSKQLELHLPSDGVVCEKIGVTSSMRNDQYSDSNIAIKFSYWSSTVYTTKVTNILFEQKRVNASLVLEVEPVITNDGNVATRVNGSNLSLLMKNGITIGSTIQFTRKSSAYNVLVL